MLNDEKYEMYLEERSVNLSKTDFILLLVSPPHHDLLMGGMKVQHPLAGIFTINLSMFDSMSSTLGI